MSPKHSPLPPTIADRSSVEATIQAVAVALEAARVSFGHGTDNPYDDAAELVFFGAGLRHEDAPGIYVERLDAAQVAAIRALVERRIRERVPTAYLTHRMWFAGHEFFVDERVLVPRSPIAELIAAQFAPWIEPERIRRVLDIGTGSGCIAIATALELPEASVDAADISADALAVTRMNIERHGVGSRVQPLQSDVYAGLAVGARYDIIVSNPPYVSTPEMEELPAEYANEPATGLAAGTDGLDIVRRILAGARAHLADQGVLIVEVGDSEYALTDAYPEVPFTWLEFERGGGGVFLLTADEVRAHQAIFAERIAPARDA